MPVASSAAYRATSLPASVVVTLSWTARPGVDADLSAFFGSRPQRVHALDSAPR